MTAGCTAMVASRARGILLGTANDKALERNRYRLMFDDPRSKASSMAATTCLASGCSC